jgi:hypothetical protein
MISHVSLNSLKVAERICELMHRNNDTTERVQARVMLHIKKIF